MTFLTTRFTTETWLENKRFRDTHTIPCIYGLGVPISDKHPYNPLYILEMNNSTNKLIGIGILSKKIHSRVPLYSNPYYNRYIYKGDRYIPAEKIPEEIRMELESTLFHGKGHMKRGKSMTVLPAKRLKPEYYDFMNQYQDGD